MKTTVSKTFQIGRPIDEVWDFLSDPNKIVTCVPGAKLTEAIDHNRYKGTVTMKIGPVVTSFNGQIEITRLDKAERIIELSGKGVDTKGKGSANMLLTGKLVDNGDQTTEVTNNMEISITGKLAQFGSRMIVDVSDLIFEQFLSNFKNRLQAAAENSNEQEAPLTNTAKPLNAFSLFFVMIWASILKLFGKAPKDS